MKGKTGKNDKAAVVSGAKAKGEGGVYGKPLMSAASGKGTPRGKGANK